MKKIIAAVALLWAAMPVMAESPYLVDGETGKYLGRLSANEYDPESVANEYFEHGSEYFPDSINNEYFEYGSPYSDRSVNNPYATSAPKVISPIGH